MGSPSIAPLSNFNAKQHFLIEGFDFVEEGEGGAGAAEAYFRFEEEGAPHDPANPAAAPPADDSDDEIVIDTTASIYIPGLLHICHNCVKDLSTVMAWWDEYVDMLRAYRCTYQEHMHAISNFACIRNCIMNRIRCPRSCRSCHAHRIDLWK